MANVELLPPTERFSVDEALEYCRREHLKDGYMDVLICGWDATGSFFSRSSFMTKAEATHLLEIAKQCATGLR